MCKRRCFFYRLNCQSSYFIDCFEYSFSPQSYSFHNQRKRNESRFFCIFQNCFCCQLCSIGSFLFCSFEFKQSCSSSKNLITFIISQCNNGIIWCCRNIKNSLSNFTFYFFWFSYSHWGMKNKKLWDNMYDRW